MSMIAAHLVVTRQFRSFTNPLPGSWGIRRFAEKKTDFFEGVLLRGNGGIRCGVFEAFSHFQIIGKNPKINKYFFDEKNQKYFWSMKKFGPKLFQKTTKITGFLN